MTIVLGNKKVQDIGSWQESFVPTYSERVKKAMKRVTHAPEICLEHARAEIKAYEQYKDEPRIIQRARFLETYLREKTIYILEDDKLISTIMPKEELGLQNFEHNHNAVLRMIGTKFYIIVQAWNPGDFAILEQVVE